MSLQVFWQSPQVIDYPEYYLPYGGRFDFKQLLRLYYSTPAQLLIGLFHSHDHDGEIRPTVWPSVNQYFALCRLWRDGTRLTWQGDGPLVPFSMLGTYQPMVCMTDTGTLAWAPECRAGGLTGADGWFLASALSASSYYRVNDTWPMDIHTGEPLASLAILSNSYIGVLRPARGTAYQLVRSATPTVHTEIVSQPGGVICFSSINTPAWNAPRDLLFIDSKTVAVLFAQTSNYGQPSIIRLFDTTSQPWSVLWEDVLPGSAHVAAWDPQHEILYACSRYPSNATLYACRLARAPATVAAPTLVSGTALRELTASPLSTLVLDGRGSVMSGQLVQWALSASVSGGALQSAYSRTNTSGVARITYVGPRLPPAGLTEAVTVTVATVEG